MQTRRLNRRSNAHFVECLSTLQVSVDLVGFGITDAYTSAGARSSSQPQAADPRQTLQPKPPRQQSGPADSIADLRNWTALVQAEADAEAVRRYGSSSSSAFAQPAAPLTVEMLLKNSAARGDSAAHDGRSQGTGSSVSSPSPASVLSAASRHAHSPAAMQAAARAKALVKRSNKTGTGLSSRSASGSGNAVIGGAVSGKAHNKYANHADAFAGLYSPCEFDQWTGSEAFSGSAADADDIGPIGGLSMEPWALLDGRSTRPNKASTPTERSKRSEEAGWRKNRSMRAEPGTTYPSSNRRGSPRTQTRGRGAPNVSGIDGAGNNFDGLFEDAVGDVDRLEELWGLKQQNKGSSLTSNEEVKRDKDRHQQRLREVEEQERALRAQAQAEALRAERAAAAEAAAAVSVAAARVEHCDMSARVFQRRLQRRILGRTLVEWRRVVVSTLAQQQRLLATALQRQRRTREQQVWRAWRSYLHQLAHAVESARRKRTQRWFRSGWVAWRSAAVHTRQRVATGRARSAALLVANMWQSWVQFANFAKEARLQAAAALAAEKEEAAWHAAARWRISRVLSSTFCSWQAEVSRRKVERQAEAAHAREKLKIAQFVARVAAVHPTPTSASSSHDDDYAEAKMVGGGISSSASPHSGKGNDAAATPPVHKTVGGSSMIAEGKETADYRVNATVDTKLWSSHDREALARTEAKMARRCWHDNSGAANERGEAVVRQGGSSRFATEQPSVADSKDGDDEDMDIAALENLLLHRHGTGNNLNGSMHGRREGAHFEHSSSDSKDLSSTTAESKASSSQRQQQQRSQQTKQQQQNPLPPRRGVVSRPVSSSAAPTRAAAPAQAPSAPPAPTTGGSDRAASREAARQALRQQRAAEAQAARDRADELAAEMAARRAGLPPHPCNHPWIGHPNAGAGAGATHNAGSAGPASAAAPAAASNGRAALPRPPPATTRGAAAAPQVGVEAAARNTAVLGRAGEVADGRGARESRTRATGAVAHNSHRFRGIPSRATHTSSAGGGAATAAANPSTSSSSPTRAGVGVAWSKATYEAACGLAELHSARAHLKWRGFLPFQKLLEQARLNTTKAQQWWRDHTLTAAWLAWQQQRQEAKVHQRRARGAALCWTADLVERRVRSRAWQRWRATCAELAHRAVAVHSNNAYHRGKAMLVLWHMAAHRKRQALNVKVRAVQDLAAKHRQRSALAQWGVALARKRAENAAAEKKAARWRQVKGWLGEE